MNWTMVNHENLSTDAYGNAIATRRTSMHQLPSGETLLLVETSTRTGVASSMILLPAPSPEEGVYR